MDYSKIKTNNTTITRDVVKFEKKTSNLYETLVVLSKRANQIGLEMREELNSKLSDFTSVTDNLEEVFENKEQIEISKFYEHLPKPTLIAINELLDEQIYFRNPTKENSENKF